MAIAENSEADDQQRDRLLEALIEREFKTLVQAIIDGRIKLPDDLVKQIEDLRGKHEGKDLHLFAHAITDRNVP